MYEEDELRYILTESWHHFQNEPGFDNTLLTVQLIKEEIIYLRDFETGEPLDNGEVRMVSQTVDWPSYLFGRHLDQNQMTLAIIIENRKIMDEQYWNSVNISKKLYNIFQWIRESLPPSRMY